MIYVLIMVVGYGGNTAAVTTQEFTSKEKCDIALTTLTNSKRVDGKGNDTFAYWYNKSFLVCVEK